jgi:hypothetical protein
MIVNDTFRMQKETTPKEGKGKQNETKKNPKL